MRTDTKTANAILRRRLLIMLTLVLVLSAGPSAVSLAAPKAQDTTSTPVPITTGTDVETQPGVPVTVGSQTLFYIGEGEGNLSAAERAASISAQITDLATNPFRAPYEITVTTSEDGAGIFVGDQLLLTISEADASANGMSLNQAGQSIGNAVDETITEVREQYTFGERARMLLGALLALGIVILVIWVINWLYRRTVRWVDERPATSTRFHRLTDTNFYRSGRWKRPAIGGLNLIRWGLIVAVLLVGVPFVLQGLPATEAVAKNMLGAIRATLARFWMWLVNYTDEFVTITLIALGAYLLIRLVRWFFGEVARGGIRIKGMDATRARYTAALLSGLIVAGAAVMAFPYLPGADSPAFHAMVIFVGALITFASTSTITNIVSGILLVYTGGFKPNDFVQIGQVQGKVTDQGMLTTELRTFRNETVTIPNSVVANSHVTNYSRLAGGEGLMMHTTVTIGYDVPWKQVHDLLVDAALATEEVLQTPRPFVLQTGLNDFNVSYDLNCLTKRPDRLLITYSHLHQHIQDKFNAAGIEILSPTYTALRDGNTITIPEADRQPGYQPPGFRIQK